MAIGIRPNLDNPQTLNEKINWLKLNYKNTLITQCSDKVLFRDYIAQSIGSQYLVPCIGIYDSPDEINFETLPDQFVVKVNWGSGQNIICKNKSLLDWGNAKKQLLNWMSPKSNHYYAFFEWCYKDIRPKILIEQYIESKDDLPDYKIFCYNGNPLNMFVAKGRQKGAAALTFTFFDKDFNRLDVAQHYKTYPGTIPKPQQWDNMFKLASILAKPFPFVRVDFYITENRLKVGELTFYHFAGLVPFDPPEWDYKLGQLLSLPEPTPNI